MLIIFIQYRNRIVNKTPVCRKTTFKQVFKYFLFHEETCENLHQNISNLKHQQNDNLFQQSWKYPRNKGLDNYYYSFH